MFLPTDFEPEIQAIGGEPLDGSGFESETPDSEFEMAAHSAEEGHLR